MLIAKSYDLHVHIGSPSPAIENEAQGDAMPSDTGGSVSSQACKSLLAKLANLVSEDDIIFIILVGEQYAL